MIYVGIDIAKLNHYASAISSDGEVLLEPFKFSNDNNGFYTLVSKLNQFEKDKVIIGLESTAHYGNNLLALLFSLKASELSRFQASVSVMPQQTKKTLSYIFTPHYRP